jgi:PAS domain S-box-containing protein
MPSRRNHFDKAGNQEDSVHPAARFVTDFTRLITDVDRLMVDIGNAAEKPRDPARANGDAQKLTLNGTISTLREHAQSFVRSLRQFELPLDRVPVPFMELDEKARILGTNDECADLLDGTATPVQGKSLFTFVAPSDIKHLREHLSMARQTNRPCVVRLSIVQRGKVCPVELRIRRQLIGRVAWYVAVVRSADHLKNASSTPGLQWKKDDPPSMHELIVSLSYAQNLASVADIVGKYCGIALRSPAGMLFMERDGDLELVYQWRSRQIPKKYLVEEMIRNGPVAHAFRTGEAVFWGQDRSPRSTAPRRLYRLLRRCHCRRVTFLPIGAAGQSPVGILAIVLPDGDEVDSALNNDLIRLGRFVSGCIVRARAYDEAVAARVKLEDGMRSKDEFLSILSHELRNPIMPILGWAVALSSGTLQAEKQNVAIEGIVRNVRALNYLIDDLFDMVRIASGKLRLQPVEIRMQDVVREALTAIQHTAESKKLRIATDISEATPAFMADPHRLQQVLRNLLNNAVKFTPGGGSIALQVRRRNDSVECIVSDTGKGIERKFLPFVFDRFRQENRSPKVDASGLGLGLAIVREIVELHGGSIEASSQGSDKGTTFILRLPLRRKHGQDAPRQLRAPEAHSGLERKRSHYAH